MRLDPVEVLAGFMKSGPMPFQVAESALKALRAAGWRLVRPGPCDNPDAPMGECGCSGIFFAEEWTGK